MIESVEKYTNKLLKDNKVNRCYPDDKTVLIKNRCLRERFLGKLASNGQEKKGFYLIDELRGFYDRRKIIGIIDTDESKQIIVTGTNGTTKNDKILG